MGGEEFANFKTALDNSGEPWKDFDFFLNEHSKHGSVTQATVWSQVEILWRNQSPAIQYFAECHAGDGVVSGGTSAYGFFLRQDFQSLGSQCFDEQKYPQAAFWYFQQYKRRHYKMDGEEYPHFKKALDNANEHFEEWKDFEFFSQ